MLYPILKRFRLLIAAGASPKPVTRAEHERRVSARLTRGVPPDADQPKRLGASAGGGTASRYRDPPMVGASAAGFSGIPRSGASKDIDGGAVQRTMKQSKK
jgi:hypothetical protein